MAQTRESRPSVAQPNIQDVFLNYARREKLAVHIRLMDGSDFEGRVKNFDRFAVIVEHAAPITWSSSTPSRRSARRGR